MTKRNSTKRDLLEIVALGKCDIMFYNGVECKNKGVVLTRDRKIYTPVFLLPSSPFDIPWRDCYLEVYPIGKPRWEEWMLDEKHRQSSIPYRDNRRNRKHRNNS